MGLVPEIKLMYVCMYILHEYYTNEMHCNTSAHGSGRRYSVILLKFLSFFLYFLSPKDLRDMALPTGNLFSSDGRI